MVLPWFHQSRIFHPRSYGFACGFVRTIYFIHWNVRKKTSCFAVQRWFPVDFLPSISPWRIFNIGWFPHESGSNNHENIWKPSMKTNNLNATYLWCLTEDGEFIIYKQLYLQTSHLSMVFNGGWWVYYCLTYIAIPRLTPKYQWIPEAIFLKLISHDMPGRAGGESPAQMTTLFKKARSWPVWLMMIDDGLILLYG